VLRSQRDAGLRGSPAVVHACGARGGDIADWSNRELLGHALPEDYRIVPAVSYVSGSPQEALSMQAAGSLTNTAPSAAAATVDELARRALLAFVLTFVAARTVVLLIMARRIPNLYLFLHHTHVHHLNYGIFLLAAVGGYLLFRAPTGERARRAALAYGIAMALTFDEFGMWLHLGGSYWQRASVDAVVVVAAALALLAYARSIRKFETRHVRAFVALALALLGFGVVL